AGARISAGKFGNVERSLPKIAVSWVNRSPVSCMPSPESPANLMMTRSSCLTCLVTASSLRPAPDGCLPPFLPVYRHYLLRNQVYADGFARSAIVRMSMVTTTDGHVRQLRTVQRTVA